MPCAWPARSSPASRPRKPPRTRRRWASCGASRWDRLLDVGRVGVELAGAQLLARRRGQLLVALQVCLQLSFLEALEVEDGVMRALRGADQLVELDLDRRGIAVQIGS